MVCTLGRNGVGDGAAACPGVATSVGDAAGGVVVLATSYDEVGEASSAVCGVMPTALTGTVGESMCTVMGGILDESLVHQLVEDYRMGAWKR